MSHVFFNQGTKDDRQSSVYFTNIQFFAPWFVPTPRTCGPDGSRLSRESSGGERTCLPAHSPACPPARPWAVSCRLGGGGGDPLRHITGPLIKTHVRQSDGHGKTVWKKLLGIKYIVTTWFQRFINKLTDHLVSIRSDRSTNPGISAPGLVGGGRR